MSDESTESQLQWWEPEVYTMFDPRWVAHRREEVDALLKLRETFSSAPPRALEIGSHRAAFLEGLATIYEPAPVLGIEMREKYHRLAQERVAAKSLPNVQLLCANAKLALPILIPPASLDAVFVTFPDPWWKTRHASRRLLDVAFLRVIARRLAPGGRLYLKSDVFDYLHAVRRFAEASGAFRPLPPERWPDERAWTLTTRERKCMRGAIPFGRGYYERLSNFDTSLPNEPESLPELDWEALATDSPVRGRPPVDVEADRMTAAAAKRKAASDGDEST